MPCGKTEEQVQQVQQVAEKKKPKRPPVVYDSAEGERLMLIRFKGDMLRRLKNAFSAEKKVLENYKGTLIGMTDAVELLETSCGDSVVRGYGFAILTFHTERDAGNWIASDKIFKQPDFPGAADSLEIAMFPLNYVPKDILFRMTSGNRIVEIENSFHTFQISFLSDFTDGQFQKNYVEPATKLLNDLGVRHGLVATMDVNKVRHSNWLGRNPFVLINVFEDPWHFKDFYYADDYKKLKQYRNSVCNTTSFYFDLAGRELKL